MSLLQIENASVYYEDFQALYDINLNVDEGEISACIGANGAGKSTLLKAISGLLTPRRGRILFDGEPIDHMPAHKRVALGIASAVHEQIGPTTQELLASPAYGLEMVLVIIAAYLAGQFFVRARRL